MTDPIAIEFTSTPMTSEVLGLEEDYDDTTSIVNNVVSGLINTVINNVMLDQRYEPRKVGNKRIRDAYPVNQYFEYYAFE